MDSEAVRRRILVLKPYVFMESNQRETNRFKFLFRFALLSTLSVRRERLRFITVSVII